MQQLMHNFVYHDSHEATRSIQVWIDISRALPGIGKWMATANMARTSDNVRPTAQASTNHSPTTRTAERLCYAHTATEIENAQIEVSAIDLTPVNASRTLQVPGALRYYRRFSEQVSIAIQTYPRFQPTT